MPWPIEMAVHMLDPVTKHPRFWPWPQEDWLFNSHALDCMLITTYMSDLMEKSDELWTTQDNKFYTALYEEPEENVSSPIPL